MSQARSDSMLKLIANRDTLIHRASEQVKCTKTFDSGQLYLTKDAVVDGHSSTPSCRESPEPRNSQNSR